MALPLVALAKLSLISASHGGLSPVVMALLWPFLLKFSFTFRPLREGCTDMMRATSLFLFQIGHIIFDREPRGDVRWRRALRLVYERIIHARRAQSTLAGEDSLFAVSILAL